MKKLSAMLAILILVSVFSSCAHGNGAEPENTTVESQSDTRIVSTQPVDENGYLLDDLENCDIDRTITMLVWSDATINEFSYE